ncbi:MAG: sigma-70 family RNA polymerase sigma factor [Rhodospirillales bacterium]
MNEVERNTPALRRYARALLRDADDADDLVQDTLERAMSRLHLFQVGSNLRAWLFTILHNLHANAVRRDQRRVTTVDVAFEGDQTGARAPNQHDALAVRDLQRALDMLPENQREVLLLIGLEDLSYRQAADVIGVPVGTVMSRLARGRERLRRLMEGSHGASGLRRVR